MTGPSAGPGGGSRRPGVRPPFLARPAALALLAIAAAGCGERTVATPTPEPTPSLPAAAFQPVGTPDPAFWPQEDLAGLCQLFTDSDNPYWGRRQIGELQRDLEALGPAPSGELLTEAARLHARLGQEFMRIGEVPRALEELSHAREIIGREGLRATWVPDVWWLSALAQLRQAGWRNCSPEGGQAGCTLTAAPGAYRDVDSARAALEMLAEFQRLSQNPRFQLVARYLVNLAHRFAGDAPDEVPAALRLDLGNGPPPAAGIRPMPDLAADLGVNAFDIAGGAVMEDLDNDGFLDLVSSTMDGCDQLKYFRSQGDGSFRDETRAAGLVGQPGALQLVQTDFDNDGWVDLYLPRGAWLFSEGRQRRSLLHNNGDGSFTDVAAAAGLAEPAYPSQAAAWGDYDNDGDLDLFQGNEEAGPGQPYPSQLFRNDGDGRFTDVAAAAGVRNLRMAKGASWGDYDNDGDQDLYVSNFGPNRLYRNDGEGRFTDVAAELGVTEPSGRSFSTWFWDYNNDGWLDLMVNVTASAVDKVIADRVGRGDPADRPRLYRNNGDGSFTDATAEAGLARATMVMGANYGDLENDGWLDMYLGTGGPGFEVILPNLLYRNAEGRSFQDATGPAGVGLLAKGHGVAWGDLDNDGDQDLFAQLGGMYPGDRAYNALFANPGYGNHWLTVKLVGTRSNRPGIGTRLAATFLEDGRRRTVQLLAGTGGSFGANSLQQEIGLGRAERLESLALWWPASGLRQVFRDLPVDRFIEITEGQDSPRELSRPAIRRGAR